MLNYLWAVSPSIFIFVIVYLIDKFREPKSTVVVSFLLGCGFVLVLYFLKIPFQFLLNSYSSDDFWDYWIWTMYVEAGFFVIASQCMEDVINISKQKAHTHSNLLRFVITFLTFNKITMTHERYYKFF